MHNSVLRICPKDDAFISDIAVDDGRFDCARDMKIDLKMFSMPLAIVTDWPSTTTFVHAHS